MAMIEQDGRTGKVCGGKFVWKLNFTMKVLRRVGASSSNGGGFLAQVRHALSKEERTVFVSYKLLNRPELFEQQLNHNSVMGGFHCLLSSTPLKQWVDEKVADFLVIASPEDMCPMQIIRKVGRQPNGSYVLNDTLQVDMHGEILVKHAHIWDVNMQVGQGSQLPLDVSVTLPLDEEAGRAYFLKIKEIVPLTTFNNMILVAGSALKAANYETLISKFGRVPTAVVFGECNSGKSLAVEAALSLYGADRWIKVQQLSTARARTICSTTSLPWSINDVKSMSDIQELLNLSYEAAVVSNLHHGYKCSSVPLITCNTPVLAQISQSNREASRLTLVPMNEPIELTHQQSAALRGMQPKASASVGQMIQLGKKVSEFKSIDMDMITAKVKSEIPVLCPAQDRLAQSYALELACSFTFLEYMGLDMKEDLFAHWKAVVVPAIQEFQCGSLYMESHQNEEDCITSFIRLVDDMIHDQPDQVYSNMCITNKDDAHKIKNVPHFSCTSEALCGKNLQKKRIVSACVKKFKPKFRSHSVTINGDSKWSHVVALDILPGDTALRWTEVLKNATNTKATECATKELPLAPLQDVTQANMSNAPGDSTKELPLAPLQDVTQNMSNAPGDSTKELQTTPSTSIKSNCLVSLKRKLPFTTECGKLLVKETLKVKKTKTATAKRTSQRYSRPPSRTKDHV